MAASHLSFIHKQGTDRAAVDAPPADDMQFLRVEQVADILGVSRATVYNMLASRELRGVKIGRAVRVRMSTLRAWIAAQEGANG